MGQLEQKGEGSTPQLALIKHQLESARQTLITLETTPAASPLPTSSPYSQYQQTDLLFDDLDLNGDGVISRTEWDNAMAARSSSPGKDRQLITAGWTHSSMSAPSPLTQRGDLYPRSTGRAWRLRPRSYVSKTEATIDSGMTQPPESSPPKSAWQSLKDQLQGDAELASTQVYELEEELSRLRSTRHLDGSKAGYVRLQDDLVAVQVAKCLLGFCSVGAACWASDLPAAACC